MDLCGDLLLDLGRQQFRERILSLSEKKRGVHSGMFQTRLRTLIDPCVLQRPTDIGLLELFDRAKSEFKQPNGRRGDRRRLFNQAVQIGPTHL